jgi:hypothetical protein
MLEWLLPVQDLKKKPNLRRKYSVADEWVMPFEVVPIPPPPHAQSSTNLCMLLLTSPPPPHTHTHTAVVKMHTGPEEEAQAA